MLILLSIAAAFSWGTADFLAGLAAARIGSRRTAFYAELSSIGWLLPLLFFGSTTTFTPPTPIFLLAILLAITMAAAKILFYDALERGPVSLVSTIASSFGAVTAAFAITGGERPGSLQLAGLVAVFLGAMAIVFPHPSAAQTQSRARTGGPLVAIIVALLWGWAFYRIDAVVSATGILFPILLSRIASVAGLGGHAVITSSSLEPPRGRYTLIVITGLLDAGGFVFYNAALSVGMTSVAAVVSSLFSAVTVALACVFLKERLRVFQWLAVAAVMAGIAMVAAN